MTTSAAPPRTNRRIYFAAAAAAVVLLLAGVAVYLVTRPERFDSPAALAGRLAELGAPCPGTLTTSGLRGQCGQGAGINWLAVDGDGFAGNRAAAVDTASVDGDGGFAAAIGDTWLVAGEDRDWVRRAADVLGGDFRP